MYQLTLLLLSLFTVSVFCDVKSDVPFAVWSADSFFNGKNKGIGYTITDTQIQQFLQSLVHTTVDENMISEINAQLRPEVLVIFLEEKLRSEYLSSFKDSFTNLRTLLKSSSQSLYAPFVKIEDENTMNKVVNELIESTKKQSGTSFYVPTENTDSNQVPTSSVVSVTLSNLESALLSSDAFTNGYPDLVVISLNHKAGDLSNRFKTSDTIIDSVNNLLSKHTTKYVSTYFPRTHDTPAWHSKVQDMRRSVLQEPQPEPLPTPTPSNSTSNGTNYNTFKLYFGGWFWELFLVCIVLIPLLIIGIFTIDNIQTPLFDEKKKK